MKEPLPIEELVQKKLGTDEIQPSDRVWRGIRRELGWKQFLQFQPGQFNIYYLGVILLSGALITTLVLTGSPDPSSEILPSPLPMIAPADSDDQVTEAVQDTGQTAWTAESVTSDQVPGAEFSTGAPSPEDSQRAISGAALDSSLRKLNPVREQQNNQQAGREGQAAIDAFFVPSVSSGCAPVSVQFINHSTHGVSYRWTIGDNVLSASDPEYLFTEPGEYIINLTVSGAGIEQASHQEMIRVFPAPEADFEIEEGFTDMEGRASINLVNYSRGDGFYRWDFLDVQERPVGRWSSGEFQPPVHLTELDKRIQSIRLIASNEYGCADTMVREIPVVIETFDQKLRFPTAFSPNPTGPGGGNFGPNQRRSDVFHPLIMEPPATYRLRIYSRRGELVFETRDLYVGWDGYILQERAAADVYVWMAEGTWSNGETFSLQGDVTLIWNEIW